MRRLLLKIIPESRLILGNQASSSNYIDSTKYIPGRMIRGLIGSQLFAQLPAGHQPETCSDKNCLFCAIFRDERIQIGPGYYRKSLDLVWPLPLSAHSCKKFPGFREAQDDENHGVFDTLLDELAWLLASGSASMTINTNQPVLTASWQTRKKQLRIRQTNGRCPHCGERLKQLPSYIDAYAYEADTPSPSITAAASPPIERRTRVGINRARMVAEQSLLYTELTLDFTMEGGAREFLATASVPDDLIDAFSKACKTYGYVGRGRSRGYGGVSMRAEAWESDSYLSLANRVAQMQTKWQTAVHAYGIQNEDLPQGLLVTVTLRSPAIFLQKGAPVRVPTPQMLGLPAEAVLLRSWTRHHVTGGWDTAIQLPRRTQLAVDAGCVFAYYLPKTTLENCLTTLEKIEEMGIGEERGAGYGIVTICADFHVAKSSINVTNPQIQSPTLSPDSTAVEEKSNEE